MGTLFGIPLLSCGLPAGQLRKDPEEFAGVLVCWFGGFVCGLLVGWFAGLLVFWFTGVLVYWFGGFVSGLLVGWFAGLLVSWFSNFS